MHPSVHCSTVSQQPEHGGNLNVYQKMDKEDVVHIYIYIYTHTTEYYAAIKNAFAATWMDREIVILNEVRER